MDEENSNLVESTSEAPYVHSIEFISITRVKLLEFFLDIPFQKIERFMRLDPILCNFPIKDVLIDNPLNINMFEYFHQNPKQRSTLQIYHSELFNFANISQENQKYLDIGSIGRLTKAAVMKSTFAKSLVRDAWANLRLKCLVLLRIADIHMRALRIEEYWKYIKELRKEIKSRLKTYADEEAYVFSILLAMEDMKEHLRRHDLDKFIEQYQISIKDALGHLKNSDFSQLLAYRVNAAVGYAGRLALNNVITEERLCRAIGIFEHKVTTQNTLKQQQKQLQWELEQMKEIQRLHEQQQQDRQKREEEQFFKEFLEQQAEMKQQDDLDYQLLFNLYYLFLQKQDAQRNSSQLPQHISNINNFMLDSTQRNRSLYESQAGKQQSMIAILSSPDLDLEGNVMSNQNPSFQTQIDEYRNKLLVQQSKFDEEGLNTKNWIVSDADRFIYYFCQLQLFKVTTNQPQTESNSNNNNIDQEQVITKIDGLIEELKKTRHKIIGKDELIQQFTDLMELLKSGGKVQKQIQDSSLEKILSNITENESSDEDNKNMHGKNGSTGLSSQSRSLSKYSVDYQAPKNLQNYIESASNKRSIHLKSLSSQSYHTNASPKISRIPYQKQFIRSSLQAQQNNNSTGFLIDQRQHSQSTIENKGRQFNVLNSANRKMKINSQIEVEQKIDGSNSNRIRNKSQDILNKNNNSREQLPEKNNQEKQEDGQNNYIQPFDIPQFSPNSSTQHEGFCFVIPNSPIPKQVKQNNNKDQQNKQKINLIQEKNSTEIGIPTIKIISTDQESNNMLNNQNIDNILDENYQKIQEITPRQRAKSSDLLKDYSIIIQAPQESEEEEKSEVAISEIKNNNSNDNQKNYDELGILQHQLILASNLQNINNQASQGSKNQGQQVNTPDQQSIQSKTKKPLSLQQQLQPQSKKEIFLGEQLQFSDKQLSPANAAILHEFNSGNNSQPELKSEGVQNQQQLDAQLIGKKDDKINVNYQHVDVIGNFSEQAEKINRQEVAQQNQKQQQQQQPQISTKTNVQIPQKQILFVNTQKPYIPKDSKIVSQHLPNKSNITSYPLQNQTIGIISQDQLQAATFLPMKTFSETAGNTSINQKKKPNILSRLLSNNSTIHSLEEQLGLVKKQTVHSMLSQTNTDSLHQKDLSVKTSSQVTGEYKKYLKEHRRWKTQTEEKEMGINSYQDGSSSIRQFNMNVNQKNNKSEQNYQNYNLKSSEEETNYSQGRRSIHLRMASGNFQRSQRQINLKHFQTQSMTSFSQFFEGNESASKQNISQGQVNNINNNNNNNNNSINAYKIPNNNMNSSINMKSSLQMTQNSNQKRQITTASKTTDRGNGNQLKQYLQRMQSNASDSSLRIIDSDCAQQPTVATIVPQISNEKKKNIREARVYQPKLLLNAFHDVSKSFSSEKNEIEEIIQKSNLFEDKDQQQTNKHTLRRKTQRDSIHTPKQSDQTIPSSQSLKNLRLLFNTTHILRSTAKESQKSKFFKTQSSIQSNGEFGRLEKGSTLVDIDTQEDTQDAPRGSLVLHEERFERFFSQSREKRNNMTREEDLENDDSLSMSFSCEESELERRKRRVKEVTMKVVSQMPAQELIPQVYETELGKVSKSIAFAVQKASLARDFESVIQQTNFRFSLLPAYQQPPKQPQLKTTKLITSSSSSSSISLSQQNQLSIQQQDNSPIASIQEIAESIQDLQENQQQAKFSKRSTINLLGNNNPQTLHIPLAQSSSLAYPFDKHSPLLKASTATPMQGQIQGVKHSGRMQTLNSNATLTPGTNMSLTPVGANISFIPGTTIALAQRINASLTPRSNIIAEENRSQHFQNQSTLLTVPIAGTFSQASASALSQQLNNFKTNRPPSPIKASPTAVNFQKRGSISTGSNLLQLIQEQQRLRRKSISKPIQLPSNEKEGQLGRGPSAESAKQINHIITELNQAKLDLVDSNRGINSKQNTLFDQHSPLSSQSPITKSIMQAAAAASLFKPTTAPSGFKKRQMMTKNSFDSESSEDMKSGAQDDDEPKKLKKPMLRRLKVYSEKSFENSDEEEPSNVPSSNAIGSQILPTGKPAQTTNNPQIGNNTNTNNNNNNTNNTFKGLKSINSIAQMFLGKKHWFNVQNKEDLNRSQIPRGDAISRKINELNLRFPVVSFCTHRIGRFQNWKINFVAYFPQSKCFQINFLSIDNLFYKMFIPAKKVKLFTQGQDSFVTIWPMVLSYLLDYLATKKIELHFEQETAQRKKILFVDTGIGSFFQHQTQEQSSIQMLSKELIQYKQSAKEREGRTPQKSSVRHNSDEDDSFISTDKKSARTKKTKFNFFLGLARKESYFPTFRDAVAAAKIKKIFEILLYRYMYDQLRPTGKKLVLKKDASTQRYKTLSKKIQKLENDLERSQIKQQLKMKMGNSVDLILSQKFGTFQFRKLVQKDVMKIPDKSEYQIEQIWKLRHRDTPYQLCSFIKKTGEGTYYLVSFSLAFKKDYNALLTVFLKKHDDGKGLKAQFDKIIQVQQLKKPMHGLNEEDMLKENALKEYRLLSLIDSQATGTGIRSAFKRPSMIKLPNTSAPSGRQSTQKKPISQKIFQDDDFKEILSEFDLNQLIRNVVLTQKIPKNFKHLCIKNLKRRIVITDDLLFLKLDKADIIRRKLNQPPEILVETEIPGDNDPRMQDYQKKTSFFNQIFDRAYVKSEFVQEKPTLKHNRGTEGNDNNDLSDSNDDSFNNFTYPSLKIKEVEEEFDRLEKVEKIDNSLLHERTFRCYCSNQLADKIRCTYKSNNMIHFLAAELHGKYDPTQINMQDSSPNSTHLFVIIFCPENRSYKTFSTHKPKAFALFNAFKNQTFQNSFQPPIKVDTSTKLAGDFSAGILKLCHKVTIEEMTKKVEIAIPNISQLPAHEILKVALLRNNSFMETQRSFKKFSIIDEITSFGKIFLQLTVFFDNPTEMLFVIEFQDFLSKSKFYRMALNSTDMSQLLGIRIFPDDSSDILIRAVRRIVCHIRFDHETFYSMPYLQFGEVWYRPYLELPTRNLVENGRRSEQGEGGMKFSNKISKHTFEKDNTLKTKVLMEGYRKSVRIIFHRTFIHKNEFYILTIQKNLVLSEFWMIFIYSLKTGRRLMGYVQSKDVEQLQFTDLPYNQTLFRLFDQGQPYQKYKSFLDAVDNKTFEQRHIFYGNEKSSFFTKSLVKLNDEEVLLAAQSEGEDDVSERSQQQQQQPQQLQKSQFQSEAQTPISQRLEQPPSMSDSVQTQQLSSQQVSQPQQQRYQQAQISPSLMQPEQNPSVHQYLSYSKHSMLPQVLDDDSFILNFQKLAKQQTDINLSVPRPISFELLHPGVQHVDSFNENEESQTKMFLLEKFIQLTNQLSRASKQFSAPSPRVNFLSRFVEIKIWEDIADKMILNNKGATHTMQFGNIAVPMQEFISLTQIVTDAGQELMVEYFIGKQKDKKGGESLLTESFEEISYPATLGYNIYLRFYYFNQVGIVHKKINLRELLNLFIADGYYKYQTNYMHSKLQQQDLNQLCDFVSYKIRSGTFSSMLNQNQFQFRRTALDSYSRKTLQTLVKEQEQEEVENSIAERFVFSHKPYRIVKVYIKLTKGIVEFLVYSPLNASTFKKKYQISQLHQVIPFIGFYFQAGLYRQLAKNFLSFLYNDLKFHFKKFLKERIAAPQ